MTKPDGFELFVESLASLPVTGRPEDDSWQRAMCTITYAMAKYLRQEQALGTPRNLAMQRLGQSMGYVFMVALCGCKRLPKDVIGMTGDAASELMAEGIATYERISHEQMSH